MRQKTGKSNVCIADMRQIMVTQWLGRKMQTFVIIHKLLFAD